MWSNRQIPARARQETPPRKRAPTCQSLCHDTILPPLAPARPRHRHLFAACGDDSPAPTTPDRPPTTSPPGGGNRRRVCACRRQRRRSSSSSRPHRRCACSRRRKPTGRRSRPTTARCDVVLRADIAPQHRQQLRQPRPLPLLRRHHLPPRHPELRGAVRRPHRHRHRRPRLRVRRRARPDRAVPDRFAGDGQRRARHQGSQFFIITGDDGAAAAELHAVRSGRRRRPRQWSPRSTRSPTPPTARRCSRSTSSRSPSPKADRHVDRRVVQPTRAVHPARMTATIASAAMRRRDRAAPAARRPVRTTLPTTTAAGTCRPRRRRGRAPARGGRERAAHGPRRGRRGCGRGAAPDRQGRCAAAHEQLVREQVAPRQREPVGVAVEASGQHHRGHLVVLRGERVDEILSPGVVAVERAQRHSRAFGHLLHGEVERASLPDQIDQCVDDPAAGGPLVLLANRPAWHCGRRHPPSLTRHCHHGMALPTWHGHAGTLTSSSRRPHR